MNDEQARQILQSLVNGADPFTGEEFAAGTLLQNASVLRALLAGCSALDDRVARAYRRAQQPKNVGRGWSSDEQERLVRAFKSGESPPEIAVKHGRTPRAIEARLEMLGMITAEQRTTKDRFGSTQGNKDQRSGVRRRRAASRTAA